MYYQIIVFLHILGSFIILMAHGGSILVAYQLKKERQLERIQALLDLSSNSIFAMYLGLLFLLVGGIWVGCLGHWWGTKWIWVSLALMLAILFYMYGVVSRFYSNLKKAAGVAYFARFRPQPAESPASLGSVGPLRRGWEHESIHPKGIVCRCERHPGRDGGVPRLFFAAQK